MTTMRDLIRDFGADCWEIGVGFMDEKQANSSIEGKLEELMEKISKMVGL